MDIGIALAGLLGGLTVGLTGMGGGALMTPMLVLVFGIDPLAAVSTDVVASLVMKPIGGGIHLRRGTVHTGIVRWLALGSVPSAFAGVLLLRALGDGDDLSERLEQLLGITLLIAASAMTARVVMQSRRPQASLDAAEVAVRVLPTVAVGLVGGLVVGLTSVGSGSLMIVLLLGLYPTLRTSTLVGTDLVQAVPLVASAALGHTLFGDLQLGLTGTLLIGCVPGVIIGAHLSTRASDRLIRPALVLVLVSSALKLLDVPTALSITGGVALASVAVATSMLAQRSAAAELAPSPA
jgi:uncharacterized membrane protein YfcA